MAITNNSNGPRNINTESGFVTLQPGETLDEKLYKVSDDDMAAIEKHGVLAAAASGDQRAGTSSIADVQREIASSATPAVLLEGDKGEGDDGLVAEDDDEVQSLKNDNTADELRALADGEGVQLEGDDNKTDMARKIATARRG